MSGTILPLPGGPNDTDVKDNGSPYPGTAPVVSEAERAYFIKLYGALLAVAFVVLIGSIAAYFMYRRRKKLAMLRQLETDAAKLDGVELVPRQDSMLPPYELPPPNRARVSNKAKEEGIVH